jgi:hypothetical protein
LTGAGKLCNIKSCGDSCYLWSTRGSKNQVYEQTFTIAHNGAILYYMDGTLGSQWPSGIVLEVYYDDDDSGEYPESNAHNGCGDFFCRPFMLPLPDTSYTRFKLRLYYHYYEGDPITFKVLWP